MNDEYTLLSVLVIILVEIGKNGVNEYFDFKSGADRFVSPENRTDFSGGKKVIIDEVLTLRQVGWISIVCLGAAILLALPLHIYSSRIIWFGAIGIFLSVAYSMPPLKLSYRGLGEITVGLTFGPVIVIGAYFLQASQIDLAPVLLSIPLGFLIASVLWINEIPDIEADRQAGKLNLVARRGRSSALHGYTLLFICAYGSIIISVILLKEPIYVAALISSVLAMKARRIAKENIMNTQQLIPANQMTILTYLATGLLLSLGALL